MSARAPINDLRGRAGVSDTRPNVRSTGMHAIVHTTELAQMARHMAVYPHQETGGELFGLWTDSGCPVVFLATGPGICARHEIAAFYQDEDYLIAAYRRARALGLDHIGSWHSHHHIGLAEPSQGDRRTVFSALEEHQRGRFLIAIGNYPHRNSEDAVEFGFCLFTADPRRVTALDVEERDDNPIRRFHGLPQARRPSPHQPRWSTRAATQRLEGNRWYADPLVQHRLAAELRALDALNAEGFAYEINLDGEALRLDAAAPGGAPVVLLLEDGFPERAPTLIVPREAAPIHWGHGDDLAAVLVELATRTEAPAQPEPVAEPSDRATLVSAFPARLDACPAPARIRELQRAARVRASIAQYLEHATPDRIPA